MSSDVQTFLNLNIGQWTKLALGGLCGLTIVFVEMFAGEITNNWKEPYLHEIHQKIDAKCIAAVRPGNYLPAECAMKAFEVADDYHLHEYGLSSFSRSAIGWFRVGDDAVLLGACSVSCEIYQIRRDTFGPKAFRTRRT